MSIHNLDRLFKPRRIAVVGASNTPAKVGYTVFRNLLRATGCAVFPVNPGHVTVQGTRAYSRVSDLPEVPDLVLICTRAATIGGIVRGAAEIGTRAAVVFSAGFGESGERGRSLEKNLGRIAARYNRFRILGPNCLGFLAPHQGINASFGGEMPKAGHVAFVSQSGALCTAVLDWARREGIGFSHFVSVGNMLDIDFGDLIDYFNQDGVTRSIILYAESITNGRKFMSASRAFAVSKPIVIYKSGRFAESARAAASHTGALAGADAVFDTAFRRAGIVRVSELGEIFDCAELLAQHKRPSGPRLTIVTNAGGPGVIAVDALLARGGELTKLADTTIRSLDKRLPSAWSHANPIDVLGDATPDRYRDATEHALNDPTTDAVLVILTPQAMTDPTRTADVVASLAERSGKTVLAAWMGGALVQEGIEHLNRSGVPTYGSPEAAVHAFLYLVSYKKNLEVLHETPQEVPFGFQLDGDMVARAFAPLSKNHPELVSEPETKCLLEAYGIRVAVTRLARSAEHAVEIAEGFGYPVVLKVVSLQIAHKSDVGGVALDLETPDEVRRAYSKITANVGEHAPGAQVDGISVQPMIRRTHAFELLLGARKDPTFGSILLLATGGTAAEVFRDRAIALPPLSERLARRQLQSLRSWPLLRGYRGAPAVDADRIIDVSMRLSYLVTDHPEIGQIDINPLLATPDDCLALDARAIIDREALGVKPPPYPHLAIRPYPHQYSGTASLNDGTSVLLRPIKPEDEPLWRAMMSACSPETIHARLGYAISKPTHDFAARFCFIDYDREMAIVAQPVAGRELAGVGRLAADANHETAEYALLVTDSWQGRGLGLALTAHCMDVAARWGIGRIEASTHRSNRRMLEIFAHFGFELDREPDGETVLASKQLTTFA